MKKFLKQVGQGLSFNKKIRVIDGKCLVENKKNFANVRSSYRLKRYP